MREVLWNVGCRGKEMSGGSYDYAYAVVERFASRMKPDSGGDRSDLRERFAEILDDVSAAMHAVEWVDSGDWVPGDEDEPIKRLLRFESAIRAHKAEFERLRLNPDPADYALWSVIR